jgi:hypothetical protein
MTGTSAMAMILMSIRTKPPKSKRPKSGAPIEPSPESIEKLADAEKAANEELQRAFDKLSEGEQAAADVAKKIEKELVRRRSTPQMAAVRPPAVIPRPTPREPNK